MREMRFIIRPTLRDCIMRSLINILFLFDNIYVLYLWKTIILVDRKLKTYFNVMFSALFL